jgi:SAM-dependent methyltransferase
MQQHWPAPERNKGPILEVLQRVLPGQGTLLELASGSGQHAVFFAQALPHWRYVPSDISPQNLASIRAYREQAQLPNLLAPRSLDVRATDWQLSELDAVYSANMLHISPWECTEALLRGAARHLRSQGQLIVYGPFRVAGQHTSESNRQFDADLRAQDASWGVRDLEEIVAFAEACGLQLRERVALPANNQCLVLQRV